MAKRKSITCKYCGMANLHWVQATTGWRLADTQEIVHECQRDHRPPLPDCPPPPGYQYASQWFRPGDTVRTSPSNDSWATVTYVDDTQATLHVLTRITQCCESWPAESSWVYSPDGTIYIDDPNRPSFVRRETPS